MAAGSENVVGVFGLFSRSAHRIVSPETSEKPMIALSGVRSSWTCWRGIPTYAGWRLRFDGSILDLPEQPCVLDRQGRLRRKCLKQIDDFRRKAACLLPPDCQAAHDLLFAQQWY